MQICEICKRQIFSGEDTSRYNAGGSIVHRACVQSRTARSSQEDDAMPPINELFGMMPLLDSGAPSQPEPEPSFQGGGGDSGGGGASESWSDSGSSDSGSSNDEP